VRTENDVWVGILNVRRGMCSAQLVVATRRLRRLTGNKRHISAIVGAQIVMVAPARAPPRLCLCGLLLSLRNGVYRLALDEKAAPSLFFVRLLRVDTPVGRGGHYGRRWPAPRAKFTELWGSLAHHMDPAVNPGGSHQSSGFEVARLD